MVVWMPMLCAMGYLNRQHAQQLLPVSRHGDKARANVSRYLQMGNLIANHAVSQMDAIEYLRKEG